MYYHKPVRTKLHITITDNGYLIEVGQNTVRTDYRQYIANDTVLIPTVMDAINYIKQSYEEEIKNWKEQEEKTAQGYEWKPKKGVAV